MNKQFSSQGGDCPSEQPIASPEFLTSALAGAGVGTWQVDMETGLATWDATTSAMLGLDPVEMTTDALIPAHPDDREAIWADLRRSLETSEPYDRMFRSFRSDGEMIWLHGQGRVFPFGTENPRFIAGVVSEVTERMQAIAARKESERQLASIVENLPGIAYRCESEAPWAMSFISEGVTRLTGFEPAHFFSRELGWEQIIAEEDRDAVVEEVAKSVSEHRKFELQYRIRHRSGELRWVHERGGAIYSETGEAIFLEGFIGDIHEQKLAEVKVREAEERFRRAAQATRDTIWDLDLQTGAVKWEAANRPFGYANDQLGQNESWWRDRVHPDDLLMLEDEIAKLARGTRDRLVAEYQFRKADGCYAEVLDRSYLIRDEQGRPQRLVGAMHDQSESKRASRELADREARLQKIFEQALVGIMEVGVDGRMQLVNPRFCEILGRSVEDLKSCAIEDYTHPDDLEWNMPLLAEKRAAGEPFQIEKRYVRPNGDTVWCNVSVSFVTLADGTVEKAIVLAEDITARKATRAALSKSEMLYRSVVEASKDCIKIISLDGVIQFVNTAGVEALEYDSVDELIGREWRDLWPAHSREMTDVALEAVCRGESVRFSASFPTPAGNQKWWDVSISPMLNENDEVDRILAISRDVTVHRETTDKLKWASEHDFLTKLPNRRAFEDRLRAAIARAGEAESDVGLLLLDLDHFKHINDTYGHSMGDELLRVIGDRLRKSLGKDEFVARLGGDEFAVIVRAKGSSASLKERGAALLDQLNSPVRFGDRTVSVGASIGGARYPADSQDADELLKNADIALYSLKASGRGGVALFRQHLREQVQVVASKLSLARSAIERRAVEPYYQPKIDLATGRVAGLEALLRWRDVDGKTRLPEGISEAFNDYDLATQIGDLMQHRVLSDLQGWLRQGLPAGFVAINAAPAEFLRDDYAERLLAKIDASDVEPSAIEVEVTEHVFFDNTSQFVARALQLLNDAGVKIALDDFGTGYSSLSHLRDFPVDVVKIDRSFIYRMEEDAEVRSIVLAVLDLAKSLNIKVVAEGIESREQMETLIAQGCPVGQGYYFGRAVEAREIPRLLCRDTAFKMHGKNNSVSAWLAKTSQ